MSASDCEWIDAMSDAECIEVFRLYAESADELLERHGSAFIARAVRYALRYVAMAEPGGAQTPPARNP
jgi:hypothetical protein